MWKGQGGESILANPGEGRWMEVAGKDEELKGPRGWLW